MPLRVDFARPEDAARIAEIYMLAFEGNAMVHAQFPSRKALKEFQDVLEARALADVADVDATLLVVRNVAPDEAETMDEGSTDTLMRNQGGGDVIGSAKWAHPVEILDDSPRPHHNWSNECSHDALQDWARATDKARDEVVGQLPHYELSSLTIHPVYQRRGAGSLMLQWGINQCKRSGRPAYLESTVEAAPFYEKYGFWAKAILNFETVETYKEIGFLYEPKEAQKASSAEL